MASSRGARKRTRGGASGASVTSEASDAKRCPPRFTGGARSQPTLASITRAGYDDELEKDSVLLQAAKNYYPEGEGDGGCSEFPPLMQAKSWTRGVPYRDSFDHAKPVDSIGNCYTPATKSMRLINMPPKRRPPPKLYGPLGDNGELQFPPPKSWQERERERLESERLEKEKHKLQKGLVYLEDLVSGAYDRKKKAEAEAKRKRIEKRRKEKEAAEIAAKEALKKHLEKLQFEEPRDPDQQKFEMIKYTEEEHYKYIHPKDLERIQYYLSTSLVDKHLPDYPVHLYKRAKVVVDKQTSNIKRRLLILTYQACVRQSEADIKEFFIMAMKSQFRPDYTYHSEAQAWFKVHKVPTDWNEARLKCFFEGGNLASPINDRLYAVMRSLMLVQSGPVFTGVHMMDSAGDYYSMEGVPLLHMPIQWAKGEPNNLKHKERSLAILPDGTFADVHDNDILPYICYKLKDGNENVSSECGTYAKGYELDPESGSCYKYHGDCVMWQRAHMICSAEGGHLLILNSEREAKLIFDRYSKKPINCNPNTVRHAAAFLHIGFTNLGVDRAFWFTLDGKRLEDSGYGRWASGEPNVLEEQCGAIARDNSGLYDILCPEQVPFICEITDPKSVFLTN